MTNATGLPLTTGVSGVLPIANLPASVIGSNHYIGTWNAATNTPTITSATAPGGAAPIGSYYVVSVAGTPTIDGVSVWGIGDWIIWDGTRWDKLDGQANPVSSVNGQQGAVLVQPQIAANAGEVLTGPTALGGAPGTLNVGGANGLAQLDASGNASAQTVLATGASTARSLASAATDWRNIKSYGVMLDGTTNDTAAWLAAYNATPNNGTLFIPDGAHLNATIPHTAGKTITYLLGGTLDYGTSAAGTNPVTNLGDGDSIIGTFAGRFNIWKNLQTATDGFGCLNLNMTNNQTTAGGVLSPFEVGASSSPGCSGYTWVVNTVLSSGATGGGNNQDVATASSVRRQAGSAAATWQYFGQTIDYTGLPPNSGSSGVIAEFDLSTNGPDGPNSNFNFASGSRLGLHLVNYAYNPPVWVASTAIPLYTAYTASPANGYTYIATKAGTTGTNQPTLPVANANFSIASISWASGIVTVNTTSAYQSTLATGDTFYFVTTGCTPSGYNVSSIAAAPILATVVSSTSFTFPLASNPGSATILGSVATAPVKDGTVVWSFGTTIATQVSRAIDIGSSNSQWGAGIAGNGEFYNAILDFSYMSLASFGGSAPAAIRLAPNMPIDFSANQTLAGQNIRTLQYNSTSGNLEYQIAGVAEVSFGASGIVSTPISGSTGSFTTISASGVVSGVGFSNYFSSPPAIGNTTANSGAFTSLTIPGSASVAINVTGSPVVALDTANATISGNAIRMKSGQTIAFEGTGALTLSNTTADLIVFANAGTPHLTVDLNSGNVTMLAGAALQLGGVLVDSSTYTNAPTTGTTVNLPNTANIAFVNPAGTLASLTVSLPTAPTSVSGATMMLKVVFSQAITALTWAHQGAAGTGGAALPSSVAIGAIVYFEYIQSTNTWFHVLPA
ncbi:MAG: hypothetical protein P4L10_11210 [Acidobacteriaceae bacterium]|nr:hypothetical protein [Acidobacteriaceae bacterium]